MMNHMMRTLIMTNSLNNLTRMLKTIMMIFKIRKWTIRGRSRWKISCILSISRKRRRAHLRMMTKMDPIIMMGMTEITIINRKYTSGLIKDNIRIEEEEIITIEVVAEVVATMEDSTIINIIKTIIKITIRITISSSNMVKITCNITKDTIWMISNNNFNRISITKHKMTIIYNNSNKWTILCKTIYRIIIQWCNNSMINNSNNSNKCNIIMFNRSNHNMPCNNSSLIILKANKWCPCRTKMFNNNNSLHLAWT